LVESPPVQPGFTGLLAQTAPPFSFCLIDSAAGNFQCWNGKLLSHHWTGGPGGCPYLKNKIFLPGWPGFGTAIAVKKEMVFALELARVRR
jgi:hypothetical protein